MHKTREFYQRDKSTLPNDFESLLEGWQDAGHPLRIVRSGIRGSEFPGCLGWIIAEGPWLTLRITHILCAVHVPG